jgi:uncharacterized C2H2 Zn-finger protein
MPVERLDDPSLQRREGQWYYACPRCGWCSALKATREAAMQSGHDHLEAKRKVAAA